MRVMSRRARNPSYASSRRTGNEWSGHRRGRAMARDELYRALKPGGRLLLNLPAFASLAGEHDVAVRAARRYTTKEARALVERHGFHVVRCSYWNMALTPAVWLVRRLSRRKPL